MHNMHFFFGKKMMSHFKYIIATIEMKKKEVEEVRQMRSRIFKMEIKEESS